MKPPRPRGLSDRRPPVHLLVLLLGALLTTATYAGEYRLDWENLEGKVRTAPALPKALPFDYRLPSFEEPSPQPKPATSAPSAAPSVPAVEADGSVVRPTRGGPPTGDTALTPAQRRERILEDVPDPSQVHPRQERVPRQARLAVNIEAHRYYDAYAQEWIPVERVVTWTNRRGYLQRQTWWNQGQWARFELQLANLAPGDFYEARVVWNDGRARTVQRDISPNPQRLLVVDEPDPFDREYTRW